MTEEIHLHASDKLSFTKSGNDLQHHLRRVKTQIVANAQASSLSRTSCTFCAPAVLWVSFLFAEEAFSSFRLISLALFLMYLSALSFCTSLYFFFIFS